jgi:7,8-dihydro-6-hydroxymethylpterin-pyrophosphokinase
MAERLFVLLPLRDLCPGWVDPRGKSIDWLIEELEGTTVVRPCPLRV